MTKEEEREYTKQLELLKEKQKKRTEKILYFQEKLKDIEDEEEIDKCLKKLDKLRQECKMDKELSEDLLNDLEVEHFLEHGCGRTFDVEYNN